MPYRTYRVSLFVAAALAVFVARRSEAHFPWLATDPEGRALLYFSEGPAERNYHVPACVQSAEVLMLPSKGKAERLDLATLDQEDFVGRRTAAPVPDGSRLTSACQYGVYHGTHSLAVLREARAVPQAALRQARGEAQAQRAGEGH